MPRRRRRDGAPSRFATDQFASIFTNFLKRIFILSEILKPGSYQFSVKSIILGVLDVIGVLLYSIEALNKFVLAKSLDAKRRQSFVHRNASVRIINSVLNKLGKYPHSCPRTKTIRRPTPAASATDCLSAADSTCMENALASEPHKDYLSYRRRWQPKLHTNRLVH